jgi:hypothetical protein
MRKPSEILIRLVGALSPAIVMWFIWLTFEPTTYAERTMYYLSAIPLVFVQLVFALLFLMWFFEPQTDRAQ